MTPAALRALASRVETEEPSEELRSAVLTAFGSEAEWLTAPNPLVSVDDAKAFQPEGWSVLVIQQTLSSLPLLRHRWRCVLQKADWPLNHFEEGKAPTEPTTAATAANMPARRKKPRR